MHLAQQRGVPAPSPSQAGEQARSVARLFLFAGTRVGAEPMPTGNDEELGKRELDPKYTRGYVHIPHLRDKLPWLYSLHPTVDAQYKLARTLRVAPAQLSTW